MGIKKILLSAILLAGTAAAVSGQGAGIVFSLVNTEKELAWTIQEEGIRKGFLKYLDRQSLVFMPAAVKGTVYYRNLETDSAALTRYPTWAEVSDDGLLAYASGPFEYRNYLYDEQAAATGHYVSIWRRKDGKDKWEMILDISINHPPADPGMQIRYDQPLSGEIPITPAYELIKSKQILIDSDDLFNVSLKAGRLEFGYNEFYADSVKVYREGHQPVSGKQAALKLLLPRKGKYAYDSADGYMSQARDIAYTFGTGHYFEDISDSGLNQRFSYVRIWRKHPSGLWKVILDIEKPLL